MRTAQRRLTDRRQGRLSATTSVSDGHQSAVASRGTAATSPERPIVANCSTLPRTNHSQTPALLLSDSAYSCRLLLQMSAYTWRLRRMLRISRRDRISNEEVRRHTDQPQYHYSHTSSVPHVSSSLATSHVLIRPWTTAERSDPVWPPTKRLEPQIRPALPNLAPHS